MLPEIDFTKIRRAPKIVMGFSDTTALLNAFNARANLTTFHGPVAKWLNKIDDPDHVFDLLAGQKVSYPMGDTDVLRPGSATGALVGGNLTLLNYLNGTEFMPDTAGKILFIEDINEEYSNIDRLFWKLRTTGVLHGITGLIIGQFSDCKDTGRRPYGFDMTDILARNTKGLKIPIVTNAPFGHESRFWTMPIGCVAKLSARGGKTSLELKEPAVSL